MNAPWRLEAESVTLQHRFGNGLISVSFPCDLADSRAENFVLSVDDYGSVFAQAIDHQPRTEVLKYYLPSPSRPMRVMLGDSQRESPWQFMREMRDLKR